MDLDIVLTGRVIERIFIILFGGMSLFLGYRLFYGIEKNYFSGDVEAKSGEGLYIKIKNLAPGIFFAGFGSLVLAISMQSQIIHSFPNTNGEATEKLRHSFSIAGDDDSDLARKAASIKLLTDFYLENQQYLSKEDRQYYQAAAVVSRNVVRDIVDIHLGTGSYELYEKSQRNLDSASPVLIQQYSPDERTIIRNVEKFLRHSLPTGNG